MVGGAFTNILNNEVIDDENKKNWAPFVAPDSGSCGRFIVTGFVEDFSEKIIRQSAILLQAVLSLENFEINPSIAGVSSEVIYVSELWRYV